VDHPSAVPTTGVDPHAAPAASAPAERVTTQPPPAPIPGPAADYASALAKEGLAAYLVIADAWRKGEMTKLRGRILDGTKPVGDASFERLLRTPKVIDRQKQILVDVAKLGRVKYQDFDIKFEMKASYKAPSAPAPGKPGEALGTEPVTLRFTILNSAAILKKHLSVPIAFPDRVRTQDGDFRVYMRKIDGQWYWNPFGW